MLGKINKLSKSEEVRCRVRQLETIDEQELRPLDTSVLELLGGGQEKADLVTFLRRLTGNDQRVEIAVFPR